MSVPVAQRATARGWGGVTETSWGFLSLCPAPVGDRSPVRTQIPLFFKQKRAQLRFHGRHFLPPDFRKDA